MSDSRGTLALHLVKSLEESGIATVYLRNYEGLPAEVGNDVDLLIPRGKDQEAIRVLKRAAEAEGWCLAGSGNFGETALYFADRGTGETLHVDLYQDFHWSSMIYARSEVVLANRRWNGRVHVPDERDELYLNVAERMVFQGKIRDHHREMALGVQAREGENHVAEAFERHLGKGGRAIAGQLMRAEWTGGAGARKAIRVQALREHGLKHPSRLVRGVLGYAMRMAKRFLSPPGRFLVFEGADGVGKSTVMDAVVPWGGKWCAGRTPHGFHWKPIKTSPWPPPNGSAVDPRGKVPRGRLASLAYLFYHLAGFWSGWIFRIFPLLVKSHLVVGDRYSYDLFLDPARFRLNLPDWVCRLASKAVPRPDLAIGLVASPEIIHARKPELLPDEIASYQKRWKDLSAGNARMITLSAEGPANEVILAVKQAIIERYAVK